MKAWSFSFLSNRSKFYGDSKNSIVNSENIFSFEDNSAGTCCGNLWLLSQDYMWSAVNMLKKSPNFSDPTKRHDTQLTLFHFNGKLS